MKPSKQELTQATKRAVLDHAIKIMECFQDNTEPSPDHDWGFNNESYSGFDTLELTAFVPLEYMASTGNTYYMGEDFGEFLYEDDFEDLDNDMTIMFYITIDIYEDEVDISIGFNTSYPYHSHMQHNDVYCKELSYNDFLDLNIDDFVDNIDNLYL